jgi:antitoxin (DNA-binding transcriptional repressor) of toxin-antitoxin stability system
MKSVGVREAKARLSELARDAAKGEVTVLTDYGKPIAMISTIEQATKAESRFDAGEFREALALPQMHGHGLLTRRHGVFGAWTNLAVAAP